VGVRILYICRCLKTWEVVNAEEEFFESIIKRNSCGYGRRGEKGKVECIIAFCSYQVLNNGDKYCGDEENIRKTLK